MRFGLDVATAGAWADPTILTDLARVAFVASKREDMTGFDVAVNVGTLGEPDHGAAITREFVEAGVTWTVELTPDTLDDHQALIRRGPPRG
jgi:hypothetical protein